MNEETSVEDVLKKTQEKNDSWYAFYDVDIDGNPSELLAAGNVFEDDICTVTDKAISFDISIDRLDGLTLSEVETNI